MLSIFPEFFNYSQWAPFILRVGLGITVIFLNFPRLKNDNKYFKALSGVQCLAAVSLFFGIFTQIGAILIIIATTIDFFKKKISKILGLLIFVIALSLMFLGPGLFSIDLPL